MSPIILFDFVLVAAVSFLVGSVPFGVLIGKALYNSDPRSGGSRSIGATNMSRLYGWKAFVITFLADASKGAIAVVFARIVTGFMPFDAMWQFDLLIVLAVLFSIVGHVFCPWLGFKGGKGISTGFGSILVAYPFVALCLLATFLVVASLSKRISAGSICAAISFPIWSYVFYGSNVPLLVVSIIVAIAVVFAHRSNIQRMMNGTEPKFSFKSSGAKRTVDEQELEKELEEEL